MTIKRVSTSPPAALRRRDGGGHMDPAYAAELRELGQEGLVPDSRPFFTRSYTTDAVAERLGEHTVASATSGEGLALGGDDDNAPEDTMSPFATSDAEDEEE